MSDIDKIEELQGLLREDVNNFQARRELAVLLMDAGFNEESLKNLLYLSKILKKIAGFFTISGLYMKN